MSDLVQICERVITGECRGEGCTKGKKAHEEATHRFIRESILYSAADHKIPHCGYEMSTQFAFNHVLELAHRYHQLNGEQDPPSADAIDTVQEFINDYTNID